jgi:hypothetical protein
MLSSWRMRANILKPKIACCRKRVEGAPSFPQLPAALNAVLKGPSSAAQTPLRS